VQQNKLFFDTVYDAIGSDILAAGGYKHVAGKLWPNMKPISSYARLKACLEEHKDEKLDPEEVHAVAKMAKAKVGSSAYLQYTGQECDCRYEDIEPEDELTSLLRSYLRDEDQQTKKKDRIDKLIDRAGLRAVR
jgi:hypothetical protein